MKSRPSKCSNTLRIQAGELRLATNVPTRLCRGKPHSLRKHVPLVDQRRFIVSVIDLHLDSFRRSDDGSDRRVNNAARGRLTLMH